MGLIEGDRLAATMTFVGGAAAGLVDEHAAHLAGGDDIKVAPGIPIDVGVDQPQIGLVHQLGGLEGAAAFIAQVGAGQPVQVVIDQRRQLIERVAVAFAPGDQ